MNSLSCQKQNVNHFELDRLIAWAKALKHKDFDTLPRAEFEDELSKLPKLRGSKTIGQVVFCGDLFLCDAEPGKLVLCRSIRQKRYWRRDRTRPSVRYEFVAVLVEDTKAIYGDYVNGSWLLPDLKSL